ELVDGNDVPRAGWLRDERNESGKVDVLLLVEVAGVPGRQLGEIFDALLLFQPRARHVVGREHYACRPELGDHVRDRPPLGVVERADARPGELEHATPSAANAAAPE